MFQIAEKVRKGGKGRQEDSVQNLDIRSDKISFSDLTQNNHGTFYFWSDWKCIRWQNSKNKNGKMQERRIGGS